VGSGSDGWDANGSRRGSTNTDWRLIIKEEARRLQLADRWWRVYRHRAWANIPFAEIPFDLQYFAASKRPGEGIFEFASLPGEMKAAWEKLASDLRLVGTAALVVPVGMWAFGSGLSLPDADIALLGIGRHRFFAFHSALLVWGMEQLYRRYLQAMAQAKVGDGGTGRSPGWLQKALGIGLGAAAIGVGLHLTIDVFQPKSIVFPFFGSLIDGTLVDDGLWLLGNALWCFRIARDLFVLALGDDFTSVVAWVKHQFVYPLFGLASR